MVARLKNHCFHRVSIVNPWISRPLTGPTFAKDIHRCKNCARSTFISLIFACKESAANQVSFKYFLTIFNAIFNLHLFKISSFLNIYRYDTCSLLSYTILDYYVFHLPDLLIPFILLWVLYSTYLTMSVSSYLSNPTKSFKLDIIILKYSNNFSITLFPFYFNILIINLRLFEYYIR